MRTIKKKTKKKQEESKLTQMFTVCMWEDVMWDVNVNFFSTV